MKFLLDTNICIYIIKQKPLSVLEKFRMLSVGDVGISVITLSELQYGVEKSSNPDKNRNALQEFLFPIEILDFEVNSSVIYGQIREYLERLGTPIGGMDMLIAAHALSLNASLVTNNIKEFQRIPNLIVENWV